MKVIVLSIAVLAIVGVLLIDRGPQVDDASYWIDLMRTGDTEIRSQARDALVELGAEAVPALIEACEDADEWIRWEAVNALGLITLEDPEPARAAIPALVGCALRDTNSHPRWRSLWALCAFPSDVEDQEIVPLLEQGASRDDQRIEWNSAVALAFLDVSSAAGILNDGVDSADEFQQWEAIYCLGMVHDQDSIGLLSAVVSNVDGYNTRLRQEAANSLRKTAASEASEALVLALQDPEAGVRWRAAMALAECANADVARSIEEALAKEQDEFARLQMEEAIARLHEPPQPW